MRVILALECKGSSLQSSCLLQCPKLISLLSKDFIKGSLQMPKFTCLKTSEGSNNKGSIFGTQ